MFFNGDVFWFIKNATIRRDTQCSFPNLLHVQNAFERMERLGNKHLQAISTWISGTRHVGKDMLQLKGKIFRLFGRASAKRQRSRAFHCNLLQEASKRIFVTITHAYLPAEPIIRDK
jgi:hypothetical protein